MQLDWELLKQQLNQQLNQQSIVPRLAQPSTC
jgi:hypothetical protein